MTTKVHQLFNLLTHQSKHGCYQTLPPKLLNQYPELNCVSYDRRLDKFRYKWITNHLNFHKKKVVEIGANIGYFSTRIADEFDAMVHAYEANSYHKKAIKLISSLMNIPNNRLIIHNKTVSFYNDESLEGGDVLILLNVLHHAGEDFMSKEVITLNAWGKNVKGILQSLSGKFNFLVFQMGYTWKGWADEIVPPYKIVDFTLSLLEQSGWRIKHIGIQKFIFNFNYFDISFTKRNQQLPVWLYSNQYKYISKVASILRRLHLNKLGDLRFRQRPMIICEKGSAK